MVLAVDEDSSLIVEITGQPVEKLELVDFIEVAPSGH